MISLNNITVSFADFCLLDDVSLVISPQDRIALVGKNGAGKSTLLKILIGQQKPTAGAVVVPSSVKLGYLPQQMVHAKDKSVVEECMTVFAELERLREKAEALGLQLAERTDYESESYAKLIEAYNEAHDRLQLHQAENPRGNVEKVLMGLGFKAKDFNRPTAEFSEGWNMRIELAKILLARPNVLLLDEPTNHLDIESLQWLESYLGVYSGALLVISHDRAFLDNVTRRTIEIVLGKIHDYKASYSHYQVLRKERIAQQRAAYENQQRLIEKTQDFIERFRYKPTKSNQVQSRVKMLEKIDRITIDEEDNSALVLKFPPVRRAGQVVVQAKDVAVRYDREPIFTHANVLVERGEKVAFVGRNGEGKTTMMKAITGLLPVCQGQMQLGYNVDLGYYAQNQQDVLDPELTVYDTLDRIATGDVRGKLRDILAAFLFRGDAVDKKVAVLSGGERSRLAMARLMLQPYNFLVLDEPTNHMDIRSKEIMKEALKQYGGTLLIVSHDRVFLDGLVEKIYEFRDGTVKEHLGGLQNFLTKLKLRSLQDLDKREGPATPAAEAPEMQRKAEAQLSYQAKKQLDRQLEKLRKEVVRIEKEVALHEQGLALMDQKIVEGKEEALTLAFSQLYGREQAALDEAMEAWTQAQETLEAFCKENKLPLN